MRTSRREMMYIPLVVLAVFAVFVGFSRGCRSAW